MSTASIQLSRASATVRSRSTRWALAHVEGRRLVTHPIFLLGIAAMAAQTLATPDAPADPSILFAIEGGGVCTFLATFLAASREQRDHAQDTYRAQPTSPRLRTEAALLSLAYGAAAGAALVLALALVGRGPGAPPDGALRPLALLDAALYYAMAGALGVLVGTWTRHIQAAALSGLVLFVSPLTLASTLSLEPLMTGDLKLFTGGNAINVVMSLGAQGVPYAITAAAGLTALAAAGALARHDRRPHIVILALAGLGAVAGLIALAVATVFAIIVLLWPRAPAHTPGQRSRPPKQDISFPLN